MRLLSRAVGMLGVVGFLGLMVGAATAAPTTPVGDQFALFVWMIMLEIVGALGVALAAQLGPRASSERCSWCLLAAVLLAAILTVPVLSHETPAVPDRAASVESVGAAVLSPTPRVGSSGGVPVLLTVPPASSPTRHPEPVHQLVPERTPQPTSHRTGRSVTGTATWFCGAGSACTRGYPAGGLYAAAGPALRVGNWRGRRVTVRADGGLVRVTLIDWCACPGGRVIDLYRASFAQLADPSRGVIKVTVSWN